MARIRDSTTRHVNDGIDLLTTTFEGFWLGQVAAENRHALVLQVVRVFLIENQGSNLEAVVAQCLA